MINLYEKTEKVTLVNPFRPPHKKLPYTALFYRTMTLKITGGSNGVQFYSQIEQVTKMNDYLNAVMALQLPFATIPTIAFSSSKIIMGEFANGFWNKVISILLSITVIGINLTFIIRQIQSAHLNWSWTSLIGEKFHFSAKNFY